MLPKCDKVHQVHMMDMVMKINHPHIRAEFMKLWHKLPTLPVPKINMGNPAFFDFIDGLWRVTIGRTGEPEFQVFTFFSWIYISEEEFLGAFK